MASRRKGTATGRAKRISDNLVIEAFEPEKTIHTESTATQTEPTAAQTEETKTSSAQVRTRIIPGAPELSLAKKIQVGAEGVLAVFSSGNDVHLCSLTAFLERSVASGWLKLYANPSRSSTFIPDPSVDIPLAMYRVINECPLVITFVHCVEFTGGLALSFTQNSDDTDTTSISHGVIVSLTYGK